MEKIYEDLLFLQIICLRTCTKHQFTFSSGARLSLFLNDLLALSVVDVASVNLVICSSPPSFQDPSDVTYTAPACTLLWQALTYNNTKTWTMLHCITHIINFADFCYSVFFRGQPRERLGVPWPLHFFLFYADGEVFIHTDRIFRHRFMPKMINHEINFSLSLYARMTLFNWKW